MPTSVELSGELACIVLTGIFDYSVQDDFQQTINNVLNNNVVKEIQVDMMDLVFIDSSGIRLLLLLNQKAVADGKSVTLINCHDPVREVFFIGGFDAVFTIR